MSEIKSLIRDRRLVRIRADRDLIRKEIKAAISDLEEAKDSLSRQRFKWATIQGYYSMFHAARALIYSRGFRERSHYALLIALKELFRNQLDFEDFRNFEEARI